MPHSPNSPEDKAHDIVEEDESIKHALSILDTPEKQKKMFEHLRTLQDEAELRSPENEEAGKEEAMEKARIDEGKTSKQKVSARQKRNEEMWPQRDKGIHRSPSAYSDLPKDQSVKSHKKVMYDLKQMPKPNLPKSEMAKEEKGVHQPSYSTQYIKNGKTQHGISYAGIKTREAHDPSTFDEYERSPKVAKEIHVSKLKELKAMPKPNLPKSEMKKEEMEKGAAHPNVDMKGVHKPVSDATTKEIPKAGKHLLDHTGRSYAGSAVRSKNIQAAKGHHVSKLKELKAMPKPNLPKSEESMEKEMKKADKSALELAKELLKIAQENPEQFEELMKATSIPMGMPKPTAPSIPKPKIPKPTATMQLKPAPTVMKEEKDESEEDESKEHEAKESKEHEEKEKEEMEKAGLKESSGNLEHQKGIHKPSVDKEGYYYSTDKGRSSAGSRATLGTSYNKTKVYHNEAPRGLVTGELANKLGNKHINEAKEEHHKVIAEQKAMPKPNLPKSEMKKEEKSEESCSYKMTKAEIMEDLKKPWQPKFKKD
jgi:hypothetical protein